MCLKTQKVKSSSCIWQSYTWKKVSKSPFVGDTGEETLHIHCSGFMGDAALSHYYSCSGKMVLKRLFIGDTWKTSAHSLFRSWGDRASTQYDTFSGKMVLNRQFLRDTGEALALHIYCSGLLGRSGFASI